MKLSTYTFLLLYLSCPIATAFTIPLQACSCTIVAVRSQAAEHLEQFSEKWDELKKKEVELERNKSDPEAFMDLALETLATAIQHVRTKEEVQEEHVVSLHKTLEKVLETEYLLQAVVLGARHDALDANEIVHTYNADGVGEDREKRRELALAVLAHHIEDYADERLHQAKDTELHVREEEEGAKKELTKLKWNEEVLIYALAELKAWKDETRRQKP